MRVLAGVVPPDRRAARSSPATTSADPVARRSSAGRRLLPRRGRPGAAGDAVGAPAARRAAAPARQLGGPGARPARAVRARRRRAPGDRRLLPRHGPPALRRAWRRCTEPAVLLLDEPFDGVDPIGVEATLEVIADARAAGLRAACRPTCASSRSRRAPTALVLRGGAAGRPSCRPPRWRARRAHVPTAASSTDALARSVADVGHLVRFRSATAAAAPGAPGLGGPRGADAGRRRRADAAARGRHRGRGSFDVLLLLPTAMAGVLLLATVAAVDHRRRPRAAAPRAGRRLPGQPDHRPPRRPRCSRRSTSPGCSRPGCWWAARRTPSAGGYAASAPAGHRCSGWSSRPRRRRPRPGRSRAYAAAATASRSSAPPASRWPPPRWRCS